MTGTITLDDKSTLDFEVDVTKSTVKPTATTKSSAETSKSLAGTTKTTSAIEGDGTATTTEPDATATTTVPDASVSDEESPEDPTASDADVGEKGDETNGRGGISPVIWIVIGVAVLTAVAVAVLLILKKLR